MPNVPSSRLRQKCNDYRRHAPGLGPVDFAKALQSGDAGFAHVVLQGHIRVETSGLATFPFGDPDRPP
ncbi:hypothetical protein [Variovorax rhizosphaerae]|uniref:Uncharacterized protein n=1 Tax=Variovorax rhizosphaerae TaxID=1836200 RepID=A0ABU8WKI7_9BURK